MQKIDMNAWDRKEIYDFFSRVSQPFYMVSFRIDVTKLKAYTERHACSFYYALIWLCTKAMAAVEDFQYVCGADGVYRCRERVPSFTDRKPGSELFHIVTMPAGDDLPSFCRKARETSLSQETFIDPSKEGSQLAYFSCLPTLRMSAVTNEMDLLAPDFAKDSVPRIAWGKYEGQNGRLELTISMEVNHRFIDGIHIEKFAAELQRRIDDLEEEIL